MNGQQRPAFALGLILCLMPLAGCSPGAEVDLTPSLTQSTPSPSDEPAPLSPCEMGDSPWLEVGKGAYSYEDFGAGDGKIELIYGPQGGWHITIALRGAHLSTEAPSEAVITGEIDGETVGEIPPYVHFRCNTSDSALEAYGYTLVLNPPPEDLHNQTITVRAKLWDPSGQVVESSNEVVIIDPTQL